MVCYKIIAHHEDSHFGLCEFQVAFSSIMSFGLCGFQVAISSIVKAVIWIVWVPGSHFLHREGSHLDCVGSR